MRLIFAILGMSICLTACQSINMVSVKEVAVQDSSHHDRESILTNKNLSSSSRNLLEKINPNVSECIEDPAKCMQILHQNKDISQEVI